MTFTSMTSTVIDETLAQLLFDMERENRSISGILLRSVVRDDIQEICLAVEKVEQLILKKKL